MENPIAPHTPLSYKTMMNTSPYTPDVSQQTRQPFAQLKQQRGQTLIEVLIAITISLFLTAGIISLFINNKRTYNEQNALARLQENARFATEALIKDIRMNGYVGCHDNPDKLVNKVRDGDTQTKIHSYVNLLEGYESTATPKTWRPSGASAPSNIVANTDAITIRYLQPIVKSGQGLIMQQEQGESDNIGTSSKKVKDKGVFAVSDCTSANIFVTNFLAEQGGNAYYRHHALSGFNNTSNGFIHPNYNTKTYTVSETDLLEAVARRYYIGNGARGPGLFVQEITDATGAELIEGVENMQLLYGEDTNGNKEANSFVTANSVTDWKAVVAVRFALLIRTVNESGGWVKDTSAYKLLNTDVYTTTSPPNDKRLRRTYSGTVSIRNNR